MTTFVLVHGA